MRLDGFFSSQGILSRSDAKKEIKRKKVKVNDQVITDNGYIIKDSDVVKYNDEINQLNQQISNLEKNNQISLNAKNSFSTSSIGIF